MNEHVDALAVLAQRSDDRLRRALEQLDVAASARVATVNDEAERVAMNVVSQASDRAGVEVRSFLHDRAWLVLGLAVGIGLMLGHTSRR